MHDAFEIARDGFELLGGFIHAGKGIGQIRWRFAGERQRKGQYG
jgi:hypothetical protein